MHKPCSIKINSAIFSQKSSEYFEPRYWQSKRAVLGQESGRGTTWFVQHGEHSLVLRHYYRGGFIRRFNKDKYVFTGLNRTRSFKEYSVLQCLFDAGLPVPEPAGARVIKSGRNYTADLLTRKIEGAQDLLKVLQKPASDRLIKDIAELLVKLHQHGVVHPDLNIQNILVDQNNKVWVIDFDQAKIMKLGARHRARMLERLERSFLKERARHGIVWTEQNWLKLRAHYDTVLQQAQTN